MTKEVKAAAAAAAAAAEKKQQQKKPYKPRAVSARAAFLPKCPGCDAVMFPVPELERARATNLAKGVANPPSIASTNAAINLMSAKKCCGHPLCKGCIEKLQQSADQVHECEYCAAPSLLEQIRRFWATTEEQIRKETSIYNGQKNFVDGRRDCTKTYPACLGCDKCPKHWLHRERESARSYTKSERRRNARVYGYVEFLSRGCLSYEALPEDARQAFDELDALGFVDEAISFRDGTVWRYIDSRALRLLQAGGLQYTMEVMKEEGREDDFLRIKKEE